MGEGAGLAEGAAVVEAEVGEAGVGGEEDEGCAMKVHLTRL